MGINWKGGLSGAGAAIENIGMASYLQNLSSAAVELRDRRLAELQSQRDARQADFSREAQERGFEHNTAQQESSQRHAINLQSRAQEHAASEGALNRDKPQELLDLYSANARRLNAEADAIRDGMKYRPSKDKPLLPQIKVERDQDGTLYNVDTASGAVGVIVPGQPAKKGETRWFGPNDPDTPATPPTIAWSLHGKPLPGGLGDLYPAIKDRTAGQGETPGRTGWDSSSKSVFFEGREIGTAGNEMIARRMVSDARNGLRSDVPGPRGPKIGSVHDDHRFKGGDPTSRESWEPVKASPSAVEPRRPSVPELVIPQARPTPKERHASAMQKMGAENLAHYHRRVADAFRDIVASGRYTPDDRPLLELAIGLDVLTPDEKRV